MADTYLGRCRHAPLSPFSSPKEVGNTTLVSSDLAFVNMRLCLFPLHHVRQWLKPVPLRLTAGGSAATVRSEKLILLLLGVPCSDNPVQTDGRVRSPLVSSLSRGLLGCR